ncbi:hypothetical protein [Maritalea sp. S77]|uniref:hypothetical protein n=1 Tax=Maritalea sp. S77 TaxID=3415125 RepID=UPI003C7AA121
MAFLPYALQDACEAFHAFEIRLYSARPRHNCNYSIWGPQMSLQILVKEIPSIGAFFEKPYMEFEYKGEMYRLEELSGGHNGSSTPHEAAVGCDVNHPVWDEERGVWVIPLENHVINIDISVQKSLKSNLPDSSPFREMKISSPRQGNRVTKGLLISSGRNKDGGPVFPVDCEFQAFIDVKVPNRPLLRNVKPFRLLARGLDQWPPLAGTTYENLDDVELFPALVPFADRIMKPLVRIPKGDKTVLTEVFEFRNNDRVTLSKIDRI